MVNLNPTGGNSRQIWEAPGTWLKLEQDRRGTGDTNYLGEQQRELFSRDGGRWGPHLAPRPVFRTFIIIFKTDLCPSQSFPVCPVNHVTATKCSLPSCTPLVVIVSSWRCIAPRFQPRPREDKGSTLHSGLENHDGPGNG